MKIVEEFFGLDRGHTRKQITRSILEGVAFSTKNISEVIRSFDVKINSVTVSGGLSQLDIVNQIKADVLGIPIKKLNSFETTSIGAALICLVSQGVFLSFEEGFKKFIKIKKVLNLI